METWFLDFKVLTQEADDERGRKNIPDEFERGSIKIYVFLRTVFLLLTSAYLAAVNAACERAPMIYPRAVSDGQFYSPPESIAGDVLLVSTDVLLCISLQYSLTVCVCVCVSF